MFQISNATTYSESIRTLIDFGGTVVNWRGGFVNNLGVSGISNIFAGPKPSDFSFRRRRVAPFIKTNETCILLQVWLFRLDDNSMRTEFVSNDTGQGTCLCAKNCQRSCHN